MLIGDPVTHNASKEKTEQLNSIINDFGAKIKPEDVQGLKLEETFPKTILSIFSKPDKKSEKFSDKLSNIYDINKANKTDNKNDPKP